jgi:hypothetical protein
MAELAIDEQMSYRLNLDGSVALDGDSPHVPTMAAVVQEGVVHDASVVPHRNGAGLPGESTGEDLFPGVPVEELQQCL